MSMNLLAKRSIQITAPIEKVWEGLTNPDLIQQYFFGSRVESNWEKGGSLIFKGEWEGKVYVDKGTILEIKAPTYLRYDYLSSISAMADVPENYAHITYELSEDSEHTLLIVTQDNAENTTKREQTEENWGQVLAGLKELLEKVQLEDKE